MLRTAKSNPGHAQLIYLGFVLTLCAGFAQVLIDSSTENLAGVAIAIISWPIAIITFLSPIRYIRTPLSSFLIFGFWSTQIILPVIATAYELNPVTFNLKQPLDVFWHNTLVFIVLLICHEIHIRILFRGGAVEGTFRRNLEKLGVYKVPSKAFLYFVGVMGLAAVVYIHLIIPSRGQSASGVIQKVIQALTPFSYAPFLLLFSDLYRSRSNWRQHIPLLSTYGVALLIVSMGQNSRATFMYAILFLGLAWILGIFSNIYRKRAFSAKSLILGLLAFFLLTGPLVDLATAMVVVRGQRKDVARSELISLTLKAFDDKELLQNYRNKTRNIKREDGWDESYLKNPFLSRFCNLKYLDLSLGMAAKVSNDDKEKFQEFHRQRLWSVYPRPLIDLLGLKVDKDLATSYAWGDYLFYLTSGNKNVLGGFRVAHISGTGLAGFGYWYLLAMVPLLLMIFFFIDLLVLTKSADNMAPKAIFSVLGLLSLVTVFMFIQDSHSIVGLASFLMRGWWELVLLYALLLFGFSLLCRPFNRENGRV